MTPKEIKALIKTLRASGISYYKNGDVELKLGDEQVKPPSPKLVKDLSAQQEKAIKDKVEQLKSLMLGSDEELMDRLFPVPAEEKESA